MCEKLIELVCDAIEDGCIGHCNHPPCYQVERVVNHLIANGVTIPVRCGECKHFGGHGVCHCHAADENGTPIFVREDDFCSYGERRNDENND